MEPTMSVNSTVASTVSSAAGGRSTPTKSRTCSAHAGESSGFQASPGMARTSAAGILVAMYSASSTEVLPVLVHEQQRGNLHRLEHVPDVDLGPDLHHLPGDVGRAAPAGRPRHVRGGFGRDDVPHRLLFLDERPPVRIGPPEVDEVELALQVLGRDAPGEVVGPRVASGRLEPDDRTSESRPHRGGQDVHCAGGQIADEHRATNPDRVQHGHEVGHPGLQRGQIDVAARQPDPSRVVRDHPGERAQLAQPAP